MANTKSNVCAFDHEVKNVLVCSRKFSHVVNVEHVTGSKYEITDGHVVRTERRSQQGSTNLEPSMVKFCSYNGLHNYFASLSNSENIEVARINPKTSTIEQLKSEKPISHSRFVNDIDWSPTLQDKPKLASVCRDSVLRIWSLGESSIKPYQKYNTVSQATFVRYTRYFGTEFLSPLGNSAIICDGECLFQLGPGRNEYHRDDDRTTTQVLGHS